MAQRRVAHRLSRADAQKARHRTLARNVRARVRRARVKASLERRRKAVRKAKSRAPELVRVMNALSVADRKRVAAYVAKARKRR